MRRLRVVLGTTAGVVAVVAGIAAAPAFAGAAAGSTSTSAPDEQAVSAQLASAATSLAQTARQAQPDTFAGVRIDMATDRVILTLTAPPAPALAVAVASTSSTLSAGTAAASTGEGVTTDLVSYSAAQISAAQTTVEAAEPSLAAAGAQVVAVGPDVINDALHVALVNPSAAEEARVSALVSVPITFETDAQMPTVAATRLNDTAGYNGGDFIDDGAEGCTSGPPVYNPSTGEQGILTDGHCGDFTKYDVWHNDDALDSAHCGYTGCVEIGQTQHVAAEGSGWDTAILGTRTYSDVDWQNSQPYNPPGTLNGYTNPQQTYSSSVVGELVCPSGGYEGMVCSTKVLLVNQTVTFGDGYGGSEIVHHVVRAQNTAQIPLGQGDSGGPVFSTPPGHLNVEGVILGEGDGIQCSTYPQRGVDCSYTIYYADFPALMSGAWSGWELKTF